MNMCTRVSLQCQIVKQTVKKTRSTTCMGCYLDVTPNSQNLHTRKCILISEENSQKIFCLCCRIQVQVQTKWNTECGILFDPSWLQPFLGESTRFTCRPVPKCCILGLHQEQLCLMFLILLVR